MAADLHAARLVAHDAPVRYDREPERRPGIGAMAKLIDENPRRAWAGPLFYFARRPAR
jgi:hypothetical protein